MVTPSADTTVSNGVYVPAGIANGDVKSAVSTTPLADFLMQLEEYTPTVSFCLYKIELLLSLTISCMSLLMPMFIIFQIPDAVTGYYLNRAGFEASDPRM